jgi:hypothetical protein
LLFAKKNMTKYLSLPAENEDEVLQDKEITKNK